MDEVQLYKHADESIENEYENIRIPIELDDILSKQSRRKISRPRHVLRSKSTPVCQEDMIDNTNRRKISCVNNGNLQTCATVATQKGVNASRKRVFFFIAIMVLGLVAVAVTTIWNSLDDKIDSALRFLETKPLAMQGFQVGKREKGNMTSVEKYYFNVGMRSDYRLQECQGPQFKRSFPNIDYSLLGYNILRGFPMATGHDPGFTKPIFSADYTNGIQTADCRFSIPKGYVVIPDISCISSFSSKTVKSNYEFARALSVAANINVGGWGAQFSASTEYKETFSEMSSGESVFILSTAKCDYYFSKLIEYDSPPLDQTFLRRVRILEKSVTSYDFFEFFNTYGTHFATMVTFGASFTYEHKMSLSKFEEKQGQGIKLGIQAGYAGVVSVGGGFNLDSSQQQSASEFMKDVETRTISVGAAPPANGDALTWASTVKDNPVPTRYTLESIENLFSAKYFHSSEVDYHKIKNKIKQYKGQYCEFLRQLGEVNSCLQLHPGVMMKKTKLSVTTEKLLLPKPDCEKKCFETQGCVAITYCVRCRPENFSYMTCYMYGARNKTIQGGIANDFETIIFTSKLNKYKIFQNTAIIGNKRQLENGTLEHKDESECFKACTNDVHCIAFTFYSKSAIIEKCHIYAEDGLLNMRSEIYTNTYIMSWKTQNLDL